MRVFKLQTGRVPLLISLPHVGTELPPEEQARYQPRALASEDTDWHLEAIYAPIAEALGASLLVPRYSRYLIDLNRGPEDAPMYPGVNNTELCPTRFFDGSALYRDGQAPDGSERQARLKTYWQPYHQALADELARLKALHGRALLWDGHSIESELPWLFEGRLPDLNLGSFQGAACGVPQLQAVAQVLAGQSEYGQVVDGRFKGGYITRRYGQPAQGVHALQMEMVQACYMVEDAGHPVPRPLVAERVERLQPLLTACLQAFLGAAP